MKNNENKGSNESATHATFVNHTVNNTDMFVMVSILHLCFYDCKDSDELNFNMKLMEKQCLGLLNSIRKAGVILRLDKQMITNNYCMVAHIF